MEMYNKMVKMLNDNGVYYESEEDYSVDGEEIIIRILNEEYFNEDYEVMIKDGMIGLIKFISEVYYINEVEVYIIERIWLEWINNIGGGRSIEKVKEMIKKL